MIKYNEDPETCRIIGIIVEVLHDYFSHIDVSRIKCYRSRGSRSTAVARIHGLSRLWLTALGIKPMYVIETLSENYDHLPIDDKIRVLIHELLHIPSRFSGGLRPHGKFVNQRLVNKLYGEFKKRGGINMMKNH